MEEKKEERRSLVLVCLDNVILSLSCLLILFSFPAPRLHSHPLFPSILLSSSQNSFLQFALPRSENCPGDLPSSSLRHPPIQFTCACAPHPQHCLRDNPRAHTSSPESLSRPIALSTGCPPVTRAAPLLIFEIVCVILQIAERNL